MQNRLMQNRILTGVRSKIEKNFGEEIRFFKGWVKNPKNVGSVMPTSGVLAKRMASVVETHSGLPVLELGPGTGVITRAILQRGVKREQLYCVEFSPEFAKKLLQDFAGVNIIEGNAFDLETSLGNANNLTFDCVVSALPLLSFPKALRIQLINDLLARIPEGRPIVQFSYGPLSPVPPIGGVTARHMEFVFRNVPPAQIWTFRKTAAVKTEKSAN